MKDVFYTILIVWVVWRIFKSISHYSEKRSGFNNSYSNKQTSNEGKTSIKYAPETKQKISDDEGEYVDFEEVK